MSLQHPRVAAAALLALAVIATAVTGCGATEVVVPSSAPVTGQPNPPAAPPPPGARFPDVPTVVIPDVTALTESSDRFASALADLATPLSGVSVVGARCDEAGRIVNRGSLTQVNNGDGSGSYSDAARSVVNNGDGSGSYSDASRSIVVNGDGSGSYSDPARSIAINADGSGTYSDAARSITVNSDGSHSYSDASQSLTVNSDGSGSYSDAARSVVVNADGSGSYSDAAHSVVNHGDGTGVVDGAPVAMEPLARLPLIGKFPPAGALAPVGKACGTLIRLSDRVLFDFDRANLRPEAGRVLDEIAAALADVDGRMQINGHTDSRGDDAYNIDLSDRRASAVVDGLRQRGVAAELVATGFGESQPIAANELSGADHPAGRQLNRRVEIVVPS